MANSAQARKRARQAVKRRARNMSARSAMRTTIKKVLNAVTAGEKEQAADAYKAAVPSIDRLVGKGLLHKNTGARYKSRLNNRVRAL